MTNGNHSLMDDIGKYEALIICVFIISLTSALITKTLDQVTFGTLMGGFVGYTFGRIFNHAQGKEEIVAIRKDIEETH